jgi:hypothetical protein
VHQLHPLPVFYLFPISRILQGKEVSELSLFHLSARCLIMPVPSLCKVPHVYTILFLTIGVNVTWNFPQMDLQQKYFMEEEASLDIH